MARKIALKSSNPSAKRTKLRKLPKPQKIARNCDFLGDAKARLSMRLKTLRKSCMPETAIVEKTPQHLIDVQKLTRTELRERYPLTYSSWKNMKSRRKDGAIVAPEFDDFGDFLTHVGPRPTRGYTLDRLDNDNPEYGPKLCAWRDKSDQANNRSTTIFLEKDGERLPLVKWAERTGQNASTMRKRVQAGWSDEEIINGERTGLPFGSNPYAYWPWPGDTDEKKLEWEKLYQRDGCKCRFKFLLRRANAKLNPIDDFLAENDWNDELAEKCEVLRQKAARIREVIRKTELDSKAWIKAVEDFEITKMKKENGRYRPRIWELHNPDNGED